MARLRVWLLALHAVVLNADDTYDVADILYIHSQQQSDSTVLPHIPRSGGLVTRIFSMRTGLRPVARIGGYKIPCMNRVAGSSSLLAAWLVRRHFLIR